MVFAFYFYYFLYAGNWDYYFSGAWTHEENQLGKIFNPGFYIFEHVIPIPKLIAVPLTFTFFVGMSYLICSRLEKAYRAYRQRINKPVSREQAQHVIFTICTVLSFWIFLSFGGRPNLNLIPAPVLLAFNALVVLVGSMWLYRTLGRDAEQYNRENLASSLRRQLNKLDINFSKFLEGRSLDQLSPDELYALAKVLPGFTHQYRLQVYIGVLQEALEHRSVNASSSLKVFKTLRQELGINDEEHWTVLTQLRSENPYLFAPRQRQILDDAPTVRRPVQKATPREDATVVRPAANKATPREDATVVKPANKATPREDATVQRGQRTETDSEEI